MECWLDQWVKTDISETVRSHYITTITKNCLFILNVYQACEAIGLFKIVVLLHSY